MKNFRILVVEGEEDGEERENLKIGLEDKTSETGKGNKERNGRNRGILLKESHELFLKLWPIHRQLGHPCKRVWMKMLKDAGLWYRESSKAVERIYVECGICKQNSNTPSNIEAGVRINTVT